MHIKKMIAPIIISILLILYLLGYVYLIFFISPPQIVLYGAGGIALIFIGVTIYVLMQRIKEIRSGEEDDLSKY